MNPFHRIYGALTGQVRVKDITKIKVLGEILPLVSINSSGHGDDYKVTYTVSRVHMENHEAARDWTEYFEVEEGDVEEFISEWIWVPKNSLAGIMSLVTFDEKRLKEWEPK